MSQRRGRKGFAEVAEEIRARSAQKLAETGMGFPALRALKSPWRPLRALGALCASRSFSPPRRLALPPMKSPRQFAAHQRGAVGKRAQLAPCALARQVFHPAIGRGDEPLGRDMTEPLAQSGGDRCGGLDRRIIEIEDAEEDRLSR